MLRINARGAVLTSVVAGILVLLFVAQWKRDEINAWRGPLNTASPPEDSIKVNKEPNTSDSLPMAPDFSAGNSTLGVGLLASFML